MQVYRGMDIGTAKPSAAERNGVPHHLIDVADIDESFDAAAFIRLAKNAEDGIRARGRLPIFCGGTGLYFNALLHGLGTAPPGDPEVRALIESTPPGQLLAELEKDDPETFAKIDRNNPRRVIRAIEVLRLTGKPFSTQRAQWLSQSGPRRDETFFYLIREQGDLYDRINHRVDEMFSRGLVSETRALLERGLQANRTAAQALGYKQVIEHLDGKMRLDETIETVKVKTRQFAKRQATWFRKQPGLLHVEITPQETPIEIAEKLTGRWLNS